MVLALIKNQLKDSRNALEIVIHLLISTRVSLSNTNIKKLLLNHKKILISLETGIHESLCSCCRATKYHPLIIELDCEDGQKLEKQIAMPSKCSCEGCLAAKASKTYSIKSGVKTG